MVQIAKLIMIALVSNSCRWEQNNSTGNPQLMTKLGLKNLLFSGAFVKQGIKRTTACDLPASPLILIFKRCLGSLQTAIT